MLLANLPAAGLMSHPLLSTFYGTLKEAAVAAERLGRDASDIVWRYNEVAGSMQYSLHVPPTADCCTTSIRASSWASIRR